MINQNELQSLVLFIHVVFIPQLVSSIMYKLNRKRILNMNVNKVRNRGVANVIGIILLVAIVVIMASIVGVYALGSELSIRESTPVAGLSINDAPGNQLNPDSTYYPQTNDEDEFIDIHHESGEPLTIENTGIIIREASTNDLVTKWDGDKWDTSHDNMESAKFADIGPTDEISPGDQLTIVLKDNGEEFQGEFSVDINHIPSEQPIASETLSIQ